MLPSGLDIPPGLALDPALARGNRNERQVWRLTGANSGANFTRMQQANGSVIRALRQRRGETIEQVAVRAGLAASSLRAIETGASRGSNLALRAIAEALGVTVEHITTPDEADDAEAAVSA